MALNYKYKFAQLIPLTWRIKRSVDWKTYRFYSQAQWWRKDQIDIWQLKKIREIIKYAYVNVPAYQQMYREVGLIPEDIKTLQDVTRIPFTDKVMLRDNFEDFKSRNFINRELKLSTTGGSTGIPLKFYITQSDSKRDTAFMNTAWESIGWKIDDTGVSLRGGFIGDSEHIFNKLNNKRYQISAFYLSANSYPKYKELILNLKPTFLHAFPSMAIELAKLVIKHRDVGILSFNHIFLGSENFYDWQKKLMRTAFPSAKIMNWYGHSEGAIWAPWCEEDEKFHVCPFYGLTELIGEDGEEIHPGENGELVGTSFWSKATPFIRYRTLDFAQKGETGCSKCGRQFQLLDSIDGRVQDMIIGKTGRKFSLVAIEGNTHSHILTDVAQFRYIQENVGQIKLAVVPKDNSFSILDKNKIESFMKDKLSDDFEIEVIVVDDLPRTKAGKYSYLEQHLDINKADG